MQAPGASEGLICRRVMCVAGAYGRLVIACHELERKVWDVMMMMTMIWRGGGVTEDLSASNGLDRYVFAPPGWRKTPEGRLRHEEPVSRKPTVYLRSRNAG